MLPADYARCPGARADGELLADCEHCARRVCRRRADNSQHPRGFPGRMCNLCALANCVFRNTVRMNSIAARSLSG